MMTPAGGFPESRAPSSQAGLVLVVDDDNSVRHTLLDLLHGTEFRSAGAASAAEAFEAVKKCQPRAILLDWALPGGIDGLAVLKALKAAASTKHIPIIMISGLKRSAAERLTVKQAGAEDLYDKTDLMSRRADFLSLLRDAVAKNKAPSTWRLLVIEDDAEFQEFIRFALARREFDVRFAGTGREGCAMARDLRPNLVILDMTLPDINGVDVFKSLHANRETQGIPVLAMSALDRTAGPLESALKEIGVDDYLPKPFGENEILQRMSKLLGRTAAGQPNGGTLARGRVRLEIDTRRVWVGERLIEHIGYKQFDLLRVMMESASGVSRKEILTRVWGGDENATVVNVTILRLRRALGFAEKEGILSIPDGYMLVG
ncbi:MAG: response regulator [Elusimicrobia bacterium]|nr:response regulator [Elusimicrobiota bacterium]